MMMGLRQELPGQSWQAQPEQRAHAQPPAKGTPGLLPPCPALQASVLPRGGKDEARGVALAAPRAEHQPEQIFPAAWGWGRGFFLTDLHPLWALHWEKAPIPQETFPPDGAFISLMHVWARVSDSCGS